MPSLADIPGLGGILQARQLNQQEGRQELQQAQGLIGILGALQTQQRKQQAAQEEQVVRGLVQQSGGDISKAVQALVSSGNPRAIELASKLKGLMPKPAEDFTLGPDQTRYKPDGTPYAFGMPKEQPIKAPPTRHRPIQVGSGYFDVTEEMLPTGDWREIGRKPVRDPTIVMPRQSQTVTTDQGLFERGHDGQLRPMMDPNQPDRQLRPPSVVTSGNQQALALRREYNANPEVRSANMLEPRVVPVGEYIVETGRGIGNAVMDAELVKLWLMTTHPKGDQISNKDMNEISKMPDLWGRVKNVAGNFVLGKTLDAETRASMWSSISNKYRSIAAARDKVKGDIVGRAGRYQIDPSLIFHAPKEE